jgi:1,4-dihydroxy-2-naphthoate octaprenyltransferase
VLLGTGAAVYRGGRVSWLQFALVLLGAVAAHISVNAYNEYQDFRSGLDARTRRTPFSGGSGLLPAHPTLARAVFAMATAALLLTCLIGLYFLRLRGVAMLYVGIPGVLVVACYTPWMIRRPWLCLFAPGLGFGTCMVLGTCVALSGHYTWTAFFASLAPFCFVSDLLLLNQFPDIDADRMVGRRHLPIVLGVRKSSVIYILFLLLGYLSIGVGVWLRYLPPGCLLGEVTLLLAVPAMFRAYRYGEQHEQLLPALGCNVMINLLTPILLAVGLYLHF